MNRVGSHWLSELAQVEKLNKDFSKCSKTLKQIFKRKNKKEALNEMLYGEKNENRILEK